MLTTPATSASTTEAVLSPEVGTSVDTYFTDHPTPPFLESYKAHIAELLAFHATTKRPIVFITSGGTTVPLENQTVRFIDNFSAGTRGATSAEHFIAKGYVVIFLHRRFSLLPYSRHYSHSTHCFLDFMEPSDDGSVRVADKYAPEMLLVLSHYREAQRQRQLLVLDYVTVSEYLHCLRAAALLLNPLGTRCMYYLAAAVSDFFIPSSQMAEHKIQSREGSLTITMVQVPKFLSVLVDSWAKGAYIVSFKLETDPAMLLPKAKQALTSYHHNIVVGNLLHSRKDHVVLVEAPHKGSNHFIETPIDRAPDIEEIEAQIIEELAKRHYVWQHSHEEGSI